MCKFQSWSLRLDHLAPLTLPAVRSVFNFVTSKLATVFGGSRPLQKLGKLGENSGRECWAGHDIR